jgi:hypothetical protein
MLIVDKNVTATEFVNITGLKSTNFWFQYITQLFCLKSVICENYAELVKLLELQFTDVVRQLNTFDVTGDSLINKHVFVVDRNDIDVDFSKLSSRKIKVVTLEN